MSIQTFVGEENIACYECMLCQEYDWTHDSTDVCFVTLSPLYAQHLWLPPPLSQEKTDEKHSFFLRGSRFLKECVFPVLADSMLFHFLLQDDYLLLDQLDINLKVYYCLKCIRDPYKLYLVWKLSKENVLRVSWSSSVRNVYPCDPWYTKG